VKAIPLEPKAIMHRPRWVAAAMGLVLAAAIAVAGFGFAQASTTAPSVPYPACFGKAPTLHVQIPNHIAYECLGLGNFGAFPSVGLYWSDNLYELNYYLHPGHGGMVVNETFFKSCAEVSQERHGAPCGLYAGEPMTNGSATGDSWANGRLIWLADGCVVDAPTDTGAVPNWCSSVITIGGDSYTPGHQMTSVEHLATEQFWQVMDHYTPDKYW
jgi:hypothetical protein